MGYYPGCIDLLTRALIGRETVSGGQFDWGGRLLKVTEAPKGSLRMVGNHSQSVKAQGSLTARPTSRAGTKTGLVIRWFRMEGPSLNG